MLDEAYAQIPEGIDVLITHTPPHGMLDESLMYGGVERPEPIKIGSTVLAEHVRRIRPLVHVFGHEHDSRGMGECDGIVSVNVSQEDIVCSCLTSLRRLL